MTMIWQGIEKTFKLIKKLKMDTKGPHIRRSRSESRTGKKEGMHDGECF